jgi:hypothetical protein
VEPDSLPVRVDAEESALRFDSTRPRQPPAKFVPLTSDAQCDPEVVVAEGGPPALRIAVFSIPLYDPFSSP